MMHGMEGIGTGLDSFAMRYCWYFVPPAIRIEYPRGAGELG